MKAFVLALMLTTWGCCCAEEFALVPALRGAQALVIDSGADGIESDLLRVEKTGCVVTLWQSSPRLMEEKDADAARAAIVTMAAELIAEWHKQGNARD
jgi:hypothetical protein